MRTSEYLKTLLSGLVLAGTLTLVTSAATAAANAATINVAEAPGASPNFILPFADCLHASANNIQDFQQLMYRPLYWFGLGSSKAVQYPLSIGEKPVVSNAGKTFTIVIKRWHFANSELITAKSVKFYLNLYRADPTGNCSYTPGYGIPDQLRSVVTSGNKITLNFTSAENVNYVLYNYLSQITPLPRLWSRSANGASPACVSGTYGAASTISACQGVETYLDALATYTATFTDAFWGAGVDGPWRLTDLTAAGTATFAANRRYEGPQRPRVAILREIAYTSSATELTDLESHKLDVGYVDPSLLPPASTNAKSPPTNYAPLASKYAVVASPPWATNFIVINLSPTNTNYALVSQLYIRQALQLGINQPALIKSFLNGRGIVTDSPLPTSTPAFMAKAIKNPYAFDTGAAKALLASHGWALANSVMTCQQPGTLANQCGAGISLGATLSLRLVWASGTPSLDAMMNAEVASWTSIGFTITTSEDTTNNVTTACRSSITTDLCDWGSGWSYTSAYYPSGESLFLPSGQANFGLVNDPTLSQLIHDSIYSKANLTAYATYAAQQLPVLYQPEVPILLEVAKSLKSSIGFVPNPFGDFNPEYWSR